MRGARAVESRPLPRSWKRGVPIGVCPLECPLALAAPGPGSDRIGSEGFEEAPPRLASPLYFIQRGFLPWPIRSLASDPIRSDPIPSLASRKEAPPPPPMDCGITSRPSRCA